MFSHDGFITWSRRAEMSDFLLETWNPDSTVLCRKLCRTGLFSRRWPQTLCMRSIAVKRTCS